jgi:hypothetical protein
MLIVLTWIPLAQTRMRPRHRIPQSHRRSGTVPLLARTSQTQRCADSSLSCAWCRSVPTPACLRAVFARRHGARSCRQALYALCVLPVFHRLQISWGHIQDCCFGLMHQDCVCAESAAKRHTGMPPASGVDSQAATVAQRPGGRCLLRRLAVSGCSSAELGYSGGAPHCCTRP